MAVTVTYSDQYLKGNAQGAYDLDSDTLKVCLMDASFSFNATSHSTYADISANELASGNGYTTGGNTITSVSASTVSTASTPHTLKVTAANSVWTASGGAIPSTTAAVIYDTTVSNQIIQCIDFGATYATPDGKAFQLNFSAGLLDLS